MSSSLKFLDIALGFLVKGWHSEGLEQMLFHITAIEACMGQKTDGSLTKLLSERVSRVISRDAEGAKEVRKHFKKLYEFRSNLVHGKHELHSDKPKEQVNLEHLRNACDFARRVVLWTLFRLAHIASKPMGPSMPSRDEILEEIDAEWERKAFEADGLKHLAPDLPKAPRK